MLSTFVAALAVLVVTEQPTKAPQNITPVFALRGRQCEMKTPAAYLIRSAEEFEKTDEKLLLRINGHRVIVDVDYTKYVVVILCSGERANFDYTVSRISESDGALLIRYGNRVVSSAGDCIAKYAPFSIIVLERSQKKLVIEQNVRFRENDPPKWESRATFASISETPK